MGNRIFSSLLFKWILLIFILILIIVCCSKKTFEGWGNETEASELGDIFTFDIWGERSEDGELPSRLTGLATDPNKTDPAGKCKLHLFSNEAIKDRLDKPLDYEKWSKAPPDQATGLILGTNLYFDGDAIPEDGTDWPPRKNTSVTIPAMYVDEDGKEKEDPNGGKKLSDILIKQLSEECGKRKHNDWIKKDNGVQIKLGSPNGEYTRTVYGDWDNTSCHSQFDPRERTTLPSTVNYTKVFDHDKAENPDKRFNKAHNLNKEVFKMDQTGEPAASEAAVRKECEEMCTKNDKCAGIYLYKETKNKTKTIDDSRIFCRGLTEDAIGGKDKNGEYTGKDEKDKKYDWSQSIVKNTGPTKDEKETQIQKNAATDRYWNQYWEMDFGADVENKDGKKRKKGSFTIDSLLENKFSSSKRQWCDWDNEVAKKLIKETKIKRAEHEKEAVQTWERPFIGPDGTELTCNVDEDGNATPESNCWQKNWLNERWECDDCAWADPNVIDEPPYKIDPVSVYSFQQPQGDEVLATSWGRLRPPKYKGDKFNYFGHNWNGAFCRKDDEGGEDANGTPIGSWFDPKKCEREFTSDELINVGYENESNLIENCKNDFSEDDMNTYMMNNGAQNIMEYRSQMVGYQNKLISDYGWEMTSDRKSLMKEGEDNLDACKLYTLKQGISKEEEEEKNQKKLAEEERIKQTKLAEVEKIKLEKLAEEQKKLAEEQKKLADDWWTEAHSIDDVYKCVDDRWNGCYTNKDISCSNVCDGENNCGSDEHPDFCKKWEILEAEQDFLDSVQRCTDYKFKEPHEDQTWQCPEKGDYKIPCNYVCENRPQSDCVGGADEDPAFCKDWKEAIKNELEEEKREKREERWKEEREKFEQKIDFLDSVQRCTPYKYEERSEWPDDSWQCPEEGDSVHCDYVCDGGVVDCEEADGSVADEDPAFCKDWKEAIENELEEEEGRERERKRAEREREIKEMTPKMTKARADCEANPSNGCFRRSLNETIGEDETDRLRKEHKYKKIKETLGKDIDYIDSVPVSTCSSGFKCVEPKGNIDEGKKYNWWEHDNECVNLDLVCNRVFTGEENEEEEACTNLNVLLVQNSKLVQDPYADSLCKKLKEDINTWDNTGN